MHAELVESLRLGLTVFCAAMAALREARQLVAPAAPPPPGAEAADLISARCRARRGVDAVLATGLDSGILLRMVRLAARTFPYRRSPPTRSSSARPAARIAATARRWSPQPDSSPTPDRRDPDDQP